MHSPYTIFQLLLLLFCSVLFLSPTVLCNYLFTYTPPTATLTTLPAATVEQITIEQNIATSPDNIYNPIVLTISDSLGVITLNTFPYYSVSLSSLSTSQQSYIANNNLSYALSDPSQYLAIANGAGGKVYALTAAPYTPEYFYSTSYLQCQAHILQSSLPFNCTNSTDYIQFYPRSIQDGANYQMEVSISNPTLTSPAIAIVYHHLYNQDRLSTGAITLATLFENRRTQARIAVVFIWCFIGITTIFLTWLISVWCLWFISYLLPFPFFFTLSCEWLLVSLYAGIMAIITWRFGLFGYLCIIFLYSFLLLTLCLTYLYKRVRYRVSEEEFERMSNLEIGKDFQRQNTRIQPHHIAMANVPDSSSGSGAPPSPHPKSSSYRVSSERNLLDDLNERNELSEHHADVNDALLQKYTQETEAHAAIAQRGLSEETTLDFHKLIPYSRDDQSADAIAYRAYLQHVLAQYNSFPHLLGKTQYRHVQLAAFGVLLFLVVTVAVIGIWNVHDYYVWDRATGTQVLEIIPASIAKAVLLVYSFDGYATTLKMNNVLFDVSTEWCGSYYNSLLVTDAQKYDSIYIPFIQRYQIDMSIYQRSNYSQYTTVNDWFTRTLRPGARPIAYPSDPTIATSPADCRLMAFEHIEPDIQVWIKEGGFTLDTLLGRSAANFYNGSMIIARLAPQDYHRYHAATDGLVTDRYNLEGTLHSVNADGMTSSNYAIYNQRSVLLYSHSIAGKTRNIAYIAIGALCVGSLHWEVDIGFSFTKGQELGYFSFGGSTIVMIFEPGAIQLDDDLLHHSRMRVESFVHMGSRIGQQY